MSVSRRRVGVFGAAAVAVAAIAGIGTLVSGSATLVSAAAATASPTYATPPPTGSPVSSPTPSPTGGGTTGGTTGTTGGGSTGGVSGSSSPSASATPSVEPIPTSSPAQADPAADAAADKIADHLASLGVSADDIAKIRDLLHKIADQFAAAGISPEDQVAALNALEPLVDAIATANLTQAQKLAAIQAGADVAQALVLLQDGSTDAFTPAQISALLKDMALTLESAKTNGTAQGVGVLLNYLTDGSVRFVLNNLQAGSAAILALSIADHTVTTSQYRSAALRADGSGTIVLTGTANDQGVATFTVPGSSLNATTPDQAKAALARAVIGVAATAKSGVSSVFATTVSQLVRPTLTTRTPTVLWHATAVLTGTAKAGAVLQLVGRENGAPFRVLRTTTADSSGRYTFSVNPSATMRFATRSNGAPESPSIVINVRAIVSETITRTARLTYRFSGKVVPVAGTVINVYRVTSTGSVLTAQVRPASTGAWTVTHKFSSSGTYSFFARSSVTKAAVAGLSAVQKVTLR